MQVHGQGRLFKPMKAGHGLKGSLPGKVQGDWPDVLRVGADAIFTRAKGTMESWIVDRKMLRVDAFRRQMEEAFPGWEAWHLSTYEVLPKTNQAKLLKNLVYWMHYSYKKGGKSKPVASSKNHWSQHFGPNTELHKLYVRVTEHETVPNWRDYLPCLQLQ